MQKDTPVIPGDFQTILFFICSQGMSFYVDSAAYLFPFLFELFMEDLRPLPRSDFCSILVSNFNAKQILLKACQK